jgi:hypothetical protein
MENTQNWLSAVRGLTTDTRSITTAYPINVIKYFEVSESEH